MKFNTEASNFGNMEDVGAACEQWWIGQQLLTTPVLRLRVVDRIVTSVDILSLCISI